MRVLLIGSGGREHALANAIVASPLLTDLRVAPGNPGTAAHNVMLDVDSVDAVVGYATAEDGSIWSWWAPRSRWSTVSSTRWPRPVSPRSVRLRRRRASKDPRPSPGRSPIGTAFPARPTAASTTSSEALAFLDRVDGPVVVKADGLAAGKGVIIPEGRAETERRHLRDARPPDRWARPGPRS